MVNIDTVYQKVLAFANKEQRGYITPQEFNLFADQAQKEIFEQYFYDLDQRLRRPGNSEEYSDIISNLREKIVIFEALGAITAGVVSVAAGQVLYRLGTVTALGSVKIEEVQPNERMYTLNSPLLSPTLKRPTFVRLGGNTIFISPNAAAVGATCTYTRLPTTPSWGYVVVNGQALYNEAANRTTNFELHPSEESELVYKILKFAGVSMAKLDIMRAGQVQEQSQQQQEKQ
tara:strand:+ start:70 stop:762 length:693 start_codon:yes stop_codon:yes gene_type:complete